MPGVTRPKTAGRPDAQLIPPLRHACGFTASRCPVSGDACLTCPAIPLRPAFPACVCIPSLRFLVPAGLPPRRRDMNRAVPAADGALTASALSCRSPRRLPPPASCHSGELRVTSHTEDCARVPSRTRDCGSGCSRPRWRSVRVDTPRWSMTAPSRSRVSLPVSHTRGHPGPWSCVGIGRRRGARPHPSLAFARSEYLPSFGPGRPAITARCVGYAGPVNPRSGLHLLTGGPV